MYLIVEFIESREVEVVPALWVTNDVCQWPDYRRSTEFKKAIKNKEHPGPSWDAFGVRILYTAENYETARLKLPRVENHTDLQPAEEDKDDIPKMKRQRLSNISFENDSDKKTRTNAVFNILPPSTKINEADFEVQAAVNHTRPTSPGYTSTPVSRQSCTSPDVSSPIAGGSMLSPEPRQLERNRLSSANEFVPLLYQILTKLDTLTDQVKVIQLSLQKKTEDTVAGEPNLEKDLLPLKDVASLLTLERRLREETDLKNEMITALGVIGGVDIKDSVWRIMKRCFTNALAKQLNWRGVNGKTAFQRLELKDVISRTVRNNTLTKAATDREIETFIKRWLHLSGDRDGGRRRREERRQAVQHSSLEDTPSVSGPRQHKDQDAWY